jgi:hypothetical protein
MPGQLAYTRFALAATCLFLVSYLAYSLTLKMEAVSSSKTSGDFYQSTWPYNIDIML